MRYISLFSGVEAATLAWEPLGWEAVAFAEIEPFPSAVLAHRWPDVPNLGDVTKVDWSEYRGTVDLVVGGSPCQAFSVAGKREGLLDERGQLMLEYVRAVREVEPRWFLWENVPGVLSQDKGRAFGTLLGEMADLGYSCAWRVLDAQFFGVAQRRRRVFLVGCLGGGAGAAAAVLFEPESVSGNTQTSKQKREALASDARGRAAGSGGGVTAFAQNTRDEVRIQGDGTISGALSAQPGMKQTTFVAEARAYRTIPLECPICGAEAVVSIDDQQEPEMFWHYSCGCSQLGCELYGRLRKSFDSREDAIADWNGHVLLNSYSIDYKQTPKFNEQLCHTLTHEGDGGIHSAVAYAEQSGCLTPWDVQSKRIFPEGGCAPTLQSGTHEHNQHVTEPLVLASAHYNAEIGEGGVAPTLIAHIQKDAPVLAMGKTCSRPSAPQTAASSSSTTNPSTAAGSCSTRDWSGPDAICMADDNARAAVDENLSGSLKVGEGGYTVRCVSSNGDDVIGALCARDYKGVGTQYVSEGKVIACREDQ